MHENVAARQKTHFYSWKNMNLRSFGVAFIAVSLSIWPTHGVVFSGTGLQWCLTGALTLTSNRRTTERPSKELLRNRLGQFSRIFIFCGFTLLHIKNDSFICTYWCQRGSRILLNWDPSVLIISESQKKNWNILDYDVKQQRIY